MLFTTALFVGITQDIYETRFCYETEAEAINALNTWDGYNDPPGNWIKQKGGIERLNPNYIKSKDY